MIYKLEHGHLYLEVDTQGAYINNFKINNDYIFYPKTQIDVDGKIKTRGGCHVCLPHFSDSSKIGQEAHGFGRNENWDIEEISTNSISLKLQKNYTGYENMFSKLTYSLEKKSLTMELLVKNLGENSFSINPGFHPYFAFNNKEEIRTDDIKIKLDKNYINKLNDSIFTEDIKSLKVDNKYLEFETNILNKYVIWSDFLDNYICVEPTYNHTALRDNLEFIILNKDEEYKFSYKIKILEE